MSATLNKNQRLFAKEYLVDLNGTQAAIRAGYSVKTASQQACTLLGHPHVQKLVAAGCEARSKNADLSAEWVLERLKTVAERCLQAVPVVDAAGRETGKYAFNAAGANRALELLGKFLAMWVDRVDVSIGKNLSDVILEAAARRAGEDRQEILDHGALAVLPAPEASQEQEPERINGRL